MLRPLPSFVCVLLLAATAAAPATIKIGEYASLTGKEAAYGDTSHKGTLLAVEELNARGGVLGHRLEGLPAP